MTRLVTVLLPLGAETDNGDGTKTRLTITEVNDGSDVLESENITTYGRIYGVQVWDDVTVNSNLKTKGTEYLNANDHPAIAINVTALDLAQIDPTIEWFNLGDRIQVSSARHGIDGLFVLRKQDIDLINPSNNKFKLGEMTGGLISHNSNTQSQITADIERITSDYVTNEQMTDAISETETTLSSAIEQTAASITSTVEQIITDPDGVVSNLQTQITQNAEAVEIWINDFEKHITFDDNGITIRADDSEVYSQQDEDSYGFYDAGGNELLVIEPEGLKATTVETKAQFILSSGDYKEWAIRKGAVVNSKHNLNFVWIGG